MKLSDLQALGVRTRAKREPRRTCRSIESVRCTSPYGRTCASADITPATIRLHLQRSALAGLHDDAGAVALAPSNATPKSASLGAPWLMNEVHRAFRSLTSDAPASSGTVTQAGRASLAMRSM